MIIVRGAWSLSVLLMLVVLALGPAVARADLAAPGPFQVSSRSVTVSRPGGSTFTAVLYYPATSTAAGAPVNLAGAPYPAISFGHGFLQAVSTYDSTLRHLASHGYLVIATTSEGGLFPNHGNFALDIRQCLTWLEQQSATPGSLLAGALAVGQYGVSGHSMGGGASILAAAADTRIRAVAVLAAANTNPSSITAASSVRVPMTLIAGSVDTIVPVATNTSIFNAALSPKLTQVIQGGFHCGFQDSSGFGCDSSAFPRAQQLEITRRAMTGFFNLYLKGQQASWPAFWGDQQLADARLVTQGASGIQVSLRDRALAGRSRDVLTTTLTVRNTGPTPTSLTMIAAQPATISAWPIAFSPAQTPVLASNQSFEVRVTITVPVARLGATIPVTLSARRDIDGGTHGSAVIQLSRVMPGVGRPVSNERPPFIPNFDPRDDHNGDGRVDALDLADFIREITRDPAAR